MDYWEFISTPRSSSKPSSFERAFKAQEERDRRVSKYGNMVLDALGEDVDDETVKGLLEWAKENGW